MDESRIEELARNLGTDAAEQIDPERVAGEVVQRLREDPIERVAIWKRARVVRVAAAVVLFVAGALAFRGISTDRADPVTDAVVTPYAMDTLSEDELTEVLDSLYVEAPVYEVTSASLYDLNEAQLVELLATLEG